ncbi:TIGR02301 family protein [Microvirga flavescens]|uniref:TIGR02301 family protein n=1 Tax=Microvirga flavescens TaxID=2249811 RepID=UPI000DD9D554|nr:TIGR02301 family protein [Microvirga flavescens]
MKPAVRVVLAGIALLLAGEPALAQNFFERLFGITPQPAPPPLPQYQPRPQPRRTTPPPTAPKQEAAPAAPVEPPPAPYEKDLLRLSEILGSLAFLRPLCSAPDAPEWPKRMQAIMENEGTSPGRKERLAGAYNKGYQAFSLTYRICTPSAIEASNRYLKEGNQLSRNIAGRYGG